MFVRMTAELIWADLLSGPQLLIVACLKQEETPQNWEWGERTGWKLNPPTHPLRTAYQHSHCSSICVHDLIIWQINDSDDKEEFSGRTGLKWFESTRSFSFIYSIQGPSRYTLVMSSACCRANKETNLHSHSHLRPKYLTCMFFGLWKDAVPAGSWFGGVENIQENMQSLNSAN